VEIPIEAVKHLENLDFVESIEEDKPMSVEPPATGSEEFETEEETSSYDGEGIRIAVLDTGIDNNHPAFQDRIIDNKDFTGDGPHDEDGHGTHVAGIAAGNGEYPGVAPESFLKNIKVLNDDGEGTLSDALAGLDYAIEKEVDIAVLSLGAETDNCKGEYMLSKAVDEAVKQGVAVSISAGNSGPSSET